ncbi:hypothetical protein [Klebsiella oxytoca]|uniref:hypothetical protein n=2 Tax=Klebsiella TaxID=570 RepID=UPI002248717E|nr:hypothetical protein [Klebsiella oxytoca]MCW9505427.1 hypothetical protein [Klebsiella oxytoca]MDM4533996.1 hypothetical protein [Klebsiella oxytoca]
MDINISDKFAKKIIECLFIGVISSAFTISFGYISDKKNAINSAYIEINQTKLKKLAEVWEQAYLLDKSIDDYRDLYIQSDAKIRAKLIELKAGLTPDNIKDFENSVNDLDKSMSLELSLKINDLETKQLLNFNNILKKNSFWISPENIKPLLEYSKAVVRMTKIAPLNSEESQKDFEKLNNEIKALSITINDVRLKILTEEL